MATTPSNDVTGLDEDRLYAALSYLTVLVVVPLVLKKDNAFVYFHAKQGLVILVGLVLALMAASWLPVVGNVLFLVLVLVDVVALVQAVLGRRWKIPIIGDVARQFRI